MKGVWDAILDAAAKRESLEVMSQTMGMMTPFWNQLVVYRIVMLGKARWTYRSCRNFIQRCLTTTEDEHLRGTIHCVANGHGLSKA